MTFRLKSCPPQKLEHKLPLRLHAVHQGDHSAKEKYAQEIFGSKEMLEEWRGNRYVGIFFLLQRKVWETLNDKVNEGWDR